MSACRQHLAAAEQKALADQKEAQERFRKWARSRVPDAEFMNVGSGPQIRQLLFAGVANANSGEDFLELERVFKASRPLSCRRPAVGVSGCLHVARATGQASCATAVSAEAFGVWLAKVQLRLQGGLLGCSVSSLGINSVCDCLRMRSLLRSLLHRLPAITEELSGFEREISELATQMHTLEVSS